MGRKRVGILVYGNPDHYPPTVNAVHLLAERFEVSVVGRNFGQSDRAYPPGVRIYRLGPGGSPRARESAGAGAKLREYGEFVRGAQRLLSRMDLILAYDAFALVAATAVRRGRPLIYQAHETSTDLPRLTSLGGYVTRLERAWAAKQANLVVLPDPERASFFQTAAGLRQAALIVPNFPLAALFPKPDLEVVLSNRRRPTTLFYRGSISEGSAIREEMAALARMPEDARFTTVGFLPGDMTTERLTEWATQAGVASRFEYLGTLPYADLQRHTLAATIGLALYKADTFGRAAAGLAANKIFEYAACALPVVVSDSPNYRQALDGEKWVAFAEPNDPSSIARAVGELTQDSSQYAERCRAAREAFESRFNYETAFSPVLAAINELTCR